MRLNNIKKVIDSALDKAGKEEGFNVTSKHYTFYRDGSFGVELVCNLNLIECLSAYMAHRHDLGLPQAGTVFKNSKGQKFKIEGMFFDQNDEVQIIVADVETARLTSIPVYSLLYFLEAYK